MFGIIIALEREAKIVINKMQNVQKETICKKTIYTGSFADNNITLIISGIGKVSACIATQILINKGINKIINIGTAGGLNKSMQVGDIYFANKAFQFDFDLTEIDDVPLGYIQDYDRVYFPLLNIKIFKDACLASGDRFSNNKLEIEKIIQNGGEIKDMEGASIAQTCFSANVKCLIIKVLTDVYGDNSKMTKQYYKNVDEICEKIDGVLETILNKKSWF